VACYWTAPKDAEKTKKRKRRGRGRKKDDGPNEAEDIERLFVGYEQPTEIPSDPEPEITAVKPAVPPALPLPRYLPQPASLRLPDTQPTDVDAALARGRHEIRRLRTQLEEQTKIAGKMEADRRERIKKLHEKVCIADCMKPILAWSLLFLLASNLFKSTCYTH